MSMLDTTEYALGAKQTRSVDGFYQLPRDLQKHSKEGTRPRDVEL